MRNFYMIITYTQRVKGATCCFIVHQICVIASMIRSQNKTIAYIDSMVHSKHHTEIEKARYTFNRDNLIARRRTFVAYAALPVMCIGLVALPLSVFLYFEDFIAVIGIWMAGTTVVSMMCRIRSSAKFRSSRMLAQSSAKYV
jgi:hypothetical protein